MAQDILYYPHINFKNAPYIKGLSLFYDNIYRIVPKGMIPTDHEELAPLIESGKIGIPIEPNRYSEQASKLFLSKLPQWDAAGLTPSDTDEHNISRLHVDKTDENVKRLFERLGCKNEHNWMHVPEDLASNYMLFLAQNIAEKNKLGLATKDWGAWTATNYFSLNGGVDEAITHFTNDSNDELESLKTPYALFSLVVEKIVPVNISDIPSSKILKFREKRKDEIANLRNCILSLHENLQELDAPEAKEAKIKDQISDLLRAQEDYRNSADIINADNLWKGTQLIAFPAATATISPLMGGLLGVAHVIFGGMYYIRNGKEELKELRLKNSASCLVDLEKSFSNYTSQRGGGDANFHAYNCMEEYVND